MAPGGCFFSHDGFVDYLLSLAAAVRIILYSHIV